MMWRRVFLLLPMACGCLRVLMPLLAWDLAQGTDAFAAAKTESQRTLGCPQLLLHPQSASVSLSSTELKFVCGDPEVKEWQEIPLDQAQNQLVALLQARGYHQPVFQRQKEKLLINTGPRTYVKKITLQAADRKSVANLQRFREFTGDPLTPELLNRLESWLKEQLAADGAPCARLDLQANGKTGNISVNILNSAPQTALKIQDAKVDGLAPGIFQRYRAFNLGRQFNMDFVRLTSRRIVSSGIVQNFYFTHSCNKSGVNLQEVAVAGEPRLLTIGVGASTEETIMLRARWRHARLGEYGSNLRFTLFGSQKSQRFSGEAEWYFLGYPSRMHLRPSITAERRNERLFEDFTTALWIPFATSLDSQHTGVQLAIGPTANYTRLLDGVGPRKRTFLSLDSRITVESHYFEYFRSSPRRGYRFSLQSSNANADFLSPITASRLKLSGQMLHNWGGLDPPVLVTGLRFATSTTILSRNDIAIEQLPVRFREFMGGSKSLRGFGRDTIPNDPLGRLTTFYLGLELRTAAFPHPLLQPFLFADLGATGIDDMSLDSPWYWNPGIGVRWESPIGVFRGTLAHGYLISATQDDRDRLEHPQFFLSYGEEF